MTIDLPELKKLICPPLGLTEQQVVEVLKWKAENVHLKELLRDKERCITHLLDKLLGLEIKLADANLKLKKK